MVESVQFFGKKLLIGCLMGIVAFTFLKFYNNTMHNEGGFNYPYDSVSFILTVLLSGIGYALLWVINKK